MKTSMTFAISLLGLSVSSTQAQASSAYEAMAAEVSAGAHKAGVRSVAVLPFTSEGGNSNEGTGISESLTTQLVRRGEVEVVERGLLRKLMAEQALGRTGMLDQTGVKHLGNILAVDAIVTGSFVASGKEMTINARLINVETGLILAASEESVDRIIPEPAPMNESLSVFSVPVPVLDPGEMTALRDAPADALDCSDAAGRADALEASILDLKARYWAVQLKNKTGLSQVKENPGSNITDPELKAHFYKRVKEYYGSEELHELDSAELARFNDADEKAFRLHEDCGTGI